MRDGDPVLFMPEPVPGVPAQKEEAQAFLDKANVGGRSGNLAALELAIRYRPYLLYLLVDRNFPADRVTARLREINPDHKVKVNVVVLCASNEKGDWLDRFGNIAKENGGVMRTFDTDPHSRVFSDVGDARKVVFIADTSLSVHVSGQLGNEISKAVVEHSPAVHFSIIIPTEGGLKAFPEDAALTPSTRENQRKADAFLDEATGTASDPIASIELAFSRKPDLIYLFSDGDFPDNKAVIAKIAELNKDKKVKVNTVGYLAPGDSDSGFLEVLRGIAKENGGTFRSVKDEDF